MEKLQKNKIFSQFYKKNEKIFTQPILTLGFFGSIFSKEIPDIIQTDSGTDVYYNIQEFKLVPIIKGEIHSPQITIIIDGTISTNIQLVNDTKVLSNKNIFSFFFCNNIYTNSDFYLYDWHNINYKDPSRLKKATKFYGKLLAYIIASREIFTFQTINLVGYSIGCNIIKHCLKEMKEINKIIDCDDIIKNVIFIGGCSNLKMEKNPDIFTSVSGKIVNIYSEIDKDLIEFNKNCIGLNEIKAQKEYEDKYEIINHSLKLKKKKKQKEYLYHIPSILFKNNYLI